MADVYSHLSVAAVTDMGRRRKNNEDAYGSYRENGVFCVADGMGGAEDGEVASHATVDAVKAMLDRFARDEKPLSLYAMKACLIRAVNEASAWIFNRSQKCGTRGTGTTFVSFCLDPEKPDSALALHAGDSRLYRIRTNKIAQITQDHSAAALAGVKDERELNPMFRGVVMRAVGVSESVELELTPFDVADGDVIFICSDGLTKMLSDEEILGIVCAKKDVQETAQALIDEANAHGGDDNVTVVLVRVGALPAPAVAFSPSECVGEQPAIAAVAQAAPGCADLKTDSTQSLPGNTVLTPATPARTTAGHVDTLFTSDSDEVLGAASRAPSKAGDGKSQRVSSGVGAQNVAESVAKPTRIRGKLRIYAMGVGVVCLLGVSIFIGQLRPITKNKTSTSAESAAPTRDPDTRQASKPTAVETDDAAKKAEEVRRAKAVEEQRSAELRQKEFERIANANKEEEARKAKEAEALRLAEQSKQKELQRIEAEKKAAAERLAKEKEEQELKRIAELKAREAKEQARKADEARKAKDAENLRLAEQERQNVRQRVEAEKKNSVTKKLLSLAKDKHALECYVAAVAIIDDAKADGRKVRSAAEQFVEASGSGASDRAVQEAQTVFVCSLSTTIAFFREFAVAEWKKNVDTYGYKATSRPQDVEHAGHVVAQWDKVVVEMSQLGDLKDDETRLKLVDLVQWIAAGIKNLQTIPGFVDAKSN